MLSSTELAMDRFVFSGGDDQMNDLPQKGQKIHYEEEEAEVVRVTPLLVIKTKNRVVCGALGKFFS